MKIKIYTLAILLFSSISSLGQAPNWLWAKSAGGTNMDVASSIAVDTSGNAYVAGNFSSTTITFGSTTLTNVGSSDIFLTKYDAGGNFLWAKSAGGTSDDEATSVAIDASGNTYVAGYFRSLTLTFGSTTLTNAGTSGYEDIFLVKYDVNGNVLWAKSAGGTNVDGATSIAMDASGNIYMAGYFRSPNIIFDSTTLINAGFHDIFLTKYDANGNVFWAKSAGGSDNDLANSVVVDVSGNIYLAGGFQSPTITFGFTTLTNTGSGDIFLTKYDAGGNFLWAKSAGGTSDDEATSVAVDASGNTYVTGYYTSSSIIFGSTILTNAGGGFSDIFLTKYDASGNVIWAKSASSTGIDQAFSIAVDASGNAYLAGWFTSSTLTFGSIILTNAYLPYGDMFLTKYDANGNVFWAKGAGGTKSDVAYSVTVDASGNSNVAGYFNSSTIIFGSTILTNADNTGNIADIFLSKLAAFAITTTQANVSCNGGNNGTATANAAGGGTSPFTYLWNTIPAQITQTATGLAAGSYKVTVTDANGAADTASVTIIQPLALTSSMSVTNASSCSATDGNATVNVSGGTMPYTYSWNPTGQTTQTITSLAVDTFIVLITDSNGCTLIDTAVVSCPFAIAQLFDQNEFAVYPNPITNNITIENPQKGVIEILNIQGQTILQRQIQQGKTDIDISGLAKGVYILRLNNNQKTTVTKILKE